MHALIDYKHAHTNGQWYVTEYAHAQAHTQIYVYTYADHYRSRGRMCTDLYACTQGKLHIDMCTYKRRHAHMHPCTFAQTRIHTTWHILGRRMYMHTYLFKSAFMESHCKLSFKICSIFHIGGNIYFLGHERTRLKTTCWVCEKQGDVHLFV